MQADDRRAMQDSNHYKLALYHWNTLIQDACGYANIELSGECHSYLLLTLVRYIQDEKLAEEAIEMDLLNESQSVIKNQLQQLKTQADHCLMLAGLCPAHIDRHSIRISHYITLGRECFARLSELVDNNDRLIYQQLARSFVDLVDVLYTIRAFNGAPEIPLIQAMELWSDTGSKAAYQVLTSNRQSIPINETFIEQAYKH